MPDFKGYIHDVGGPTANFRRSACDKQKEHGVCPNKRCLVPRPCKNLIADHSEYIDLLTAIEQVKGVKKVFIRSGIRFDYLLADPDDTFFRKLVKDHVSGQLKVAPEHCAANVLSHMGKPDVAVYDKFREKYMRLNEEIGKNQFLVPYLMSSHPGSTMDDAAELALYTKRIGLAPEQVQDFYPTPGTASTVMFYTGIDPFTGKPIYTATSYREKQLQRALLQWRRPENRRMIYEAMNYCSERGKEMLKELLSGRPQGERKQDKNGKPAPVGSKQKRTEQGSEKKQPNKPAEKAAERTYVPYAEKKERGWAVSKKGGKKKGTKKSSPKKPNR
jgi:radical SAM superfamily enzyme YgiQ (UPF0313 family)